MCRYSFTVILLAVFFSYCSAAGKADDTTFVNSTRPKFKILGVFGHLGKSHFDMFQPLLEELARRGHRVTVISYFPRSESAKAKKPLPTYKDINLRTPDVDVVNVIDLKLVKHGFYSAFLDLIMLQRFATTSCETALLRNAAVAELIRSNETFDVMITESFNTDCFLSFAYRFNVPYLTMSSHQTMPWVNGNMGNVDNPSYIMTIFSGYDEPMNFYSRMSNTLAWLLCNMAYEYWYRPIDQAVADKAFGLDLPKLRTLAEQSQALLVNTHASIHGNRPQLSNVVEVGGLHISPKINPLPKDIAEFLDNAHEGVLYFSLGSMIKLTTMPKEKMNAIVNVISSLPHKVLWKWESDRLPYKMNNVMAKKWLPQFDVLNHPNVKCYFGHGGLLGLSEAVYAGVPMVLLPMYGDQFHNSYSVKARGVAEVLAYNDLQDEQFLRRALNEIFNNASYRENARKLARAYRDRPSSPLETAVWWTEYIARGNSGSYLRSKGMDLPWYQRHLIDVVLVLIIVSAVLIYILFRFFLIKLLLSLLRAVKGKPGSEAKDKDKRKED
ncbi:hypothetical protein DMN91_004559 [Ooceraea biroi]|uniref:Uncharacterized protein n=3 Tax=Ooceraea biroi TaxID=2015173 RepID=A0A3L8DPI9_OOCBI|nr:hypothetical protein DMN91_004559 [Ooceraea biroi]